MRAGPGPWRRLELSDGFWRDLDWWDEHLESNNCVPLVLPTATAAVQAGTDASDWGAGEIIYLNGTTREETKLVFTAAEKRRPINWRELLGILRVLQVWGPRLRGSRLLVETDNMAASTARRRSSGPRPSTCRSWCGVCTNFVAATRSCSPSRTPRGRYWTGPTKSPAARLWRNRARA